MKHNATWQHPSWRDGWLLSVVLALCALWAVYTSPVAGLACAIVALCVAGENAATSVAERVGALVAGLAGAITFAPRTTQAAPLPALVVGLVVFASARVLQDIVARRRLRREAAPVARVVPVSGARRV